MREFLILLVLCITAICSCISSVDGYSLHQVYLVTKESSYGDQYWMHVFHLKGKLTYIQRKRNRKFVQAVFWLTVFLCCLFFIML